MAGLEPANEGVKVPCLTAWLHPYWEERAGIKSHPSLFVGWVKGLEPSTPGTTIRCSNQLSYTHHIFCIRAIFAALLRASKMVRQKGLEPPAYCLEGSCSIQLSYWRKWIGAGDGNRTRIPSLEGWCPGHCATPACALRRNRQLCYISTCPPHMSRKKSKFSPFSHDFTCAAHQRNSAAASAASSRRRRKLCRSG